MKKNFMVISLGVTLLGFFQSYAMKVSPETVDKVSSAVVSIKLQQMHSAYGQPATGEGTGFLVDREHGIVVTNRHIASIDIQTQFTGVFEDGTHVPLTFLWSHPTYDFAFLKADPQRLSPKAQGLSFAKKVAPRQEVFIIGNNQTFSHSLQTGTLNNLYSLIPLYWPIPSFEINVNTKGGSSGSPVCNKEGQVIGINYGSSDTAAFAVPASYVVDALDSVLKNKTPVVGFSGAFFDQVNANEAVEAFGYPQDSLTQLYEAQPHGCNRLLMVQRLLPGFEDPQGLQLGDILQSVDGQVLGTDFYLWDHALNQAEGKKVPVTVWREGQWVDLQISSVDLNAYACRETLDFGGITFALADPIRSLMKGIPMGSVIAARADGSNLFRAPSGLFVQITKMAGKPIHSLEDLKGLLPTLKTKFPLWVRELNFFRVEEKSDFFSTNQGEQCGIGEYDPNFYPDPFTIRFDEGKKTWVREVLKITPSAE